MEQTVSLPTNNNHTNNNIHKIIEPNNNASVSTTPPPILLENNKSSTIQSNPTITSPITSPGHITKKRNRISFVCQSCRKSKTKCNKDKPSCSRCKKLGIFCVYDVETQPPPKNLNKLQTIQRLNEELIYWKNRALSNENNNNSNIIKNNNTTNSMMNENQTDSSFNFPPISDYYLLTTQQLQSITYPIKLYKDHPKLILNKIAKRDVKPLTENYILLEDKFISTLICSIFIESSTSNTTILPAITSNLSVSRIQPGIRRTVNKLKLILLDQSHSSTQRRRIEAFIDRLLQASSNSGSNPNDESVTTSSTTTAVTTATTSASTSTSASASSPNTSPPTSPISSSTKTKKKSGITTSMEDIFSLFFSNQKYQYLEDHCPPNGDYSPLLKSYIKSFEEFFPPMNIINAYKNHFYENIYKNLPFLDKDMFEEALASILYKESDDNINTNNNNINNPVNEKVKIHLGHAGLRSKVENLAILAVILKLAYISLRFVEEGEEDTENPIFVNKEILDKYPIENDAIILAEKCIASENLFACANENIVTCLLYIWAFFVFSPEEGDFFIEHPTDIISGLVVMLSNSIGLHRDPSVYSNLRSCVITDKRLLNHRRLLWLAVVTSACFESTLKGRYSCTNVISQDLFIENIRDPEALNEYMNRVKADMGTDYRNQQLLSLHELCFKRMQLSIMLCDLDSIVMDHSSYHPLSSFDILMNKIDAFLNQNFDSSDIHTPTNTKFDSYSTKRHPFASDNTSNDSSTSPIPVVQTNTINGNNEFSSDATNNWYNQLNHNTIDYSIGLHSRIMCDLMLLRTSTALFLHFEKLLATKTLSLEQGLSIYYTYFEKCCKISLKLVNYFKNFFGVGYGICAPLSNYMVTKMAQLSLMTVLFSLIGIIMRLELACISLNSMITSHSQNNNTEKISELLIKQNILKNLQKTMEDAVINIHYLASKYLRFTYYSVFKMLAICDIIIIHLRKGELWSTLIKIRDISNTKPTLAKGLAISLNVNLSDIGTIFNDFKSKNFLIEIGNDELKNLSDQVSFINSQYKVNMTDSATSKSNQATSTDNNTTAPETTTSNTTVTQSTTNSTSIVGFNNTELETMKDGNVSTNANNDVLSATNIQNIIKNNQAVPILNNDNFNQITGQVTPTTQRSSVESTLTGLEKLSSVANVLFANNSNELNTVESSTTPFGASTISNSVSNPVPNNAIINSNIKLNNSDNEFYDSTTSNNLMDSTSNNNIPTSQENNTMNGDENSAAIFNADTFEFTGGFGRLDLFNYDFLFGN
ncbi:hypothetical protein TBLA_0E00700 [Henningerozyma blattae CBS 6284]|uniref:Zn(2)-C6 fungal-type domain-containing protein n=1 Tax=Henningerozyma blattae (strain ATCC 34711 / CBS 6284 / DSM 70876 / NBRC 10599 / NRRL Y-10934 / UCD 77-7) TaxID=1071380 RepID=I2H429_HENB6|nr:hypothetical protein TBLA_0E00700 [Tetrapisispora blattae CBS 6284]CCH61131.1 hypothetical protein TBLA_0E00700 [Tetrapisispora blattae CBS 6284]